MLGLALAWITTGLPGCAVTPAAPVAAQQEDLLTGRLAIRAERSAAGINPSLSTSFELTGSETRGSLRLLSPLGTTLADAHWSPGGVLLRTDNQWHDFSSLDDMARQVFGQDVPLRALWHWLRGKPWPEAAAVPMPDHEGFTQLGWQVHTHQLADGGQLTAHRNGPPGQVLLRVRLDR